MRIGPHSPGRFRPVSELPELSADERERFTRALVDGIVVETSGSTAHPKRVALTAEALTASALATEAQLGPGNWVLALPVSYIAGIMVVIRSLVSGTALVDLRDDPFDAGTFCAAISTLPEGTWFTSLVPAQLARLVDFAESTQAGRDALARFEAILVGGQAIPAQLVERAKNLGATVIRTYGSAETAGGVVYDGIPIGDTQLRISPDGVLEISTSSLANNYVGDPEASATSFVDGWFRTSDRAHFEDGVLVIDGRVDDVIVTGGVKVSLADIERALEAAGVSVVASWFPDDEWGKCPPSSATDRLTLTKFEVWSRPYWAKQLAPTAL